MRKINLLLDTRNRVWYYSATEPVGGDVPGIAAGEEIEVSVQLCAGDPGAGVTADTSFAGTQAVGAAVVDNNYSWFGSAKLAAALTAGTAVNVLAVTAESRPRELGTVRLSASEQVSYCSVAEIADGKYELTVCNASWIAAPFTPQTDYAAGAVLQTVEQPLIVSANAVNNPAQGIFKFTLDANNPVYLALAEGNSSIPDSLLEFTVYNAGRAQLRASLTFNCAGTISGKTGSTGWSQNLWSAADSRYLQLAGGTVSGTVYVVDPEGPTDNYVSFNGGTITAVSTAAGGSTDIDGGSVACDTVETDELHANVGPYEVLSGGTLSSCCDGGYYQYEVTSGAVIELPTHDYGSCKIVYDLIVPASLPSFTFDSKITWEDGLPDFSSAGIYHLEFETRYDEDEESYWVGSYRPKMSEYLSQKGDKIVALTSSTISAIPVKQGTVYTYTLTGSETVTFGTPTSGYMPTFEVHLTQPATAVTFTFGSTIWWPDGDHYSSSGSAPDFTTGSRKYALVFRYDGTRWLGNLAYTSEA